MRINGDDHTWHWLDMCPHCGNRRPHTIAVEGHHTYRECDACKGRVLLGRDRELDDRYGD